MSLADEILLVAIKQERGESLRWEVEQSIMTRLCKHLDLEIKALSNRWGMRRVGESRWQAMLWPLRSLDDCKWFFKRAGVNMPESGPYNPVKATAHVLRTISPKSGEGA